MYRILVVDDSTVIRKLVTTALSEDPQIEVVGTAANGRIALQKLEQLRPDAVTLDVEMPVMDGLATLAEIRRIDPKLPVIMFSTLTERGAATTLEALSLGASDYVTKPANVGSITESMASVRSQLVPKIKALCGPRLAPPAPGSGSVLQGGQAGGVAAAAAGPALARPAVPGQAARPVDLLVIGCSTGGPDALTSVLSQLPATFPVPVLAVVHMPPVFTTMFAERLNRTSALQVREASDGDQVKAGEVLVAPGGWHMRVARSGLSLQVRLDQGPEENFCRPAVDPLFRSAVEVFGAGVLGVVLTGMGQDGMLGAQRIVDAGGTVLAQDEASSVVWGMPGAVAHAGLARQILPLSNIPLAIQSYLRKN